MWAIIRPTEKDKPENLGETFTLEWRDGFPTYDELKEVNEWFDLTTLAAGPNGRRIVAVVDDEGLLKGLPPTVTLERSKTTLVGPIVLMAVDGGGETVAMTEAEKARIRVGQMGEINFRYGKLIPLLEVSDA